MPVAKARTAPTSGTDGRASRTAGWTSRTSRGASARSRVSAAAAGSSSSPPWQPASRVTKNVTKRMIGVWRRMVFISVLLGVRQTHLAEIEVGEWRQAHRVTEGYRLKLALYAGDDLRGLGVSRLGGGVEEVGG